MSYWKKKQDILSYKHWILDSSLVAQQLAFWQYCSLSDLSQVPNLPEWAGKICVNTFPSPGASIKNCSFFATWHKTKQCLTTESLNFFKIYGNSFFWASFSLYMIGEGFQKRAGKVLEILVEYTPLPIFKAFQTSHKSTLNFKYRFYWKVGLMLSL